MKCKTFLIAIFALALALPAFAAKKHVQRAMIEKMEAVPCGAKEHGMSGLGSIWASIGITSINSDEKLCPQYMLRTDDMEYHVRPTDKKHPVLLPIGKEGQIQLSKDAIEMRVDDGKKRRYQVVSMKPIDHTQSPDLQGAKYDQPLPNATGKPMTAQTPAQQGVQSVQPPPVPKPN